MTDTLLDRLRAGGIEEQEAAIRIAELEAQLAAAENSRDAHLLRADAAEHECAQLGVRLDISRGARRETEADAARLRAALETIAAWPFDIMGDCVADARKLAQAALSPDEQPAAK